MKKIIFLIILLLFSSCSKRGQKRFSQIPNIKIYFSSQTNIPDKLISLIKRSEKSIHLACYDISLPSVTKALLEARKKGIDVKIITDDQTLKRNIQMQNFLKSLNVKSDRGKSALMHHKFVVIDRKFVWTGSFNITYGAAYQDDNNVIVINSPRLAENFEAEFKKIWEGDSSSLKMPYPVIKINNTRIKTYFSPDGGCEEAIIKKINKAKKSICFATFTFTNRKIANAIVRKFNQGIEVRGIIERESFSPYCRYWLFKDIKADIKWDNNFYLLHHKFFIIDNEILITGSYNPTRAAEERNGENILILENPEICSIYQEEFKRLWRE